MGLGRGQWRQGCRRLERGGQGIRIRLNFGQVDEVRLGRHRLDHLRHAVEHHRLGQLQIGQVKGRQQRIGRLGGDFGCEHGCFGLGVGCNPHRLVATCVGGGKGQVRRDHRRRGRNRAGQRDALAAQSQRVGHGLERRSRPRARTAPCNVLDPGRQRRQGLAGHTAQGVVGGFLLGQPGVEQLLLRPGGRAELCQADHARTALERVKRPPQGGQLLGIGRISVQRLDRGRAGRRHLARLVQKDVQQVVIGGQLGRRRVRHNGIQPGRRLDRVQLLQRRVQRDVVALAGHGRGMVGGLCQRGAAIQGRLCRHLIQLLGRTLVLQRLERAHGRRRRRGETVRECRVGARRTIGGATHASTQKAELVARLIVDKQLARQRGLVAEGVDEKTHGPQAVAQFLEPIGLP